MGFGKFFAKLLVYQIVFVSIYYGLTNLTKSSNEFKDKLYSLDRYLNLGKEFSFISYIPGVDDLLRTNTELFYKIYLVKIGLFALMGLLGFKLGAYLSVLARVFYLMTFHNPFLP
jgi:hypothetical protein